MIRPLSEADLERWIYIRQAAYQDFTDYREPGNRARLLSRLPYGYGAFAGTELASAAFFYPMPIYLAGRLVDMVGLAGVQTAPEYRRRGHVKALLLDGLKRLHQSGVGWCLEYPFDPFYYAKYGWQSVASAIALSIPSQLLYQAFTTRVRPQLKRVTLEPSLAQVQAIYHTWARSYNGTLSRDEAVRPDWSNLIRAPWETRERHLYLAADAYCVLQPHSDQAADREEAIIYDYAFTSPQGRLNLLAFWGNLSGQYERVRVTLPPDEPLARDLDEFLKPISYFQVRIVDIQAALTSFASLAEARFAIAVSDDFCPWNEGVFAVSLSPQGVMVEASDQAPDLSLDVRTLAALLFGDLSAAAAANTGLLQGDIGVAKQLAKLAADHRPFMAKHDYF